MSGLYNHTTKFKAITTTDMKSDEEESSLENNSEFGLDQIGSNLSKMDQNGSSAKDPIIALLSEYCHSKVLNIDYLLGKSSQPFTNKAAKAKTTSLKRKKSEKKSYENQNTHLKNINNPQALSSPPRRIARLLLCLLQGRALFLLHRAMVPSVLPTRKRR